MGFGSNFFGAATAALPLGAKIGVRGIEIAQKQKEDDRANLIAKEKLGLLKKVDKRQAKLLQMKIEDDKLNNLTKSLARTSDPRERNNLIFQFRHTNADNERMSAATQVFDEFSIEQIKKLDGFNKIIELSKKGLKTHEEGAQAHMDRKALYIANSQDYPVEYIEYDRHFGLNDPVLNERNRTRQKADFKEGQKKAGMAQANLAFTNLNSFLKLYADDVKSDKQKKSKKSLRGTKGTWIQELKARERDARVDKAIFQYRDGMKKSEQSSEIADRAIRGAFDKYGVDISKFHASGLASLETIKAESAAKRQPVSTMEQIREKKAKGIALTTGEEKLYEREYNFLESRDNRADRKEKRDIEAGKLLKMKDKTGYIRLKRAARAELRILLEKHGLDGEMEKPLDNLANIKKGAGAKILPVWMTLLTGYDKKGLTSGQAEEIKGLVEEIMSYNNVLSEMSTSDIPEPHTDDEKGSGQQYFNNLKKPGT